MGRDSISKVANVDSWHYFAVRVGIVLLIVLMSCSNSSAYSVLTHEEIVDLLWTAEIRPHRAFEDGIRVRWPSRKTSASSNDTV